VVTRYLRLTGTHNTVNAGFHVVEWEVYGTPGAAATPQIVTSTAGVTVREGGTSTFGVKLDAAPAGLVTVTVGWESGDSDLGVIDGRVLRFDFLNWNREQVVTVAAAEDADTVNGSAVIRCSGAGLVSKYVTATEQENDGIVIENLALASRGTTIWGSNGANWGALIDGVTTGYTGSTGFGYTVWKNDPRAPGVMILDLKADCTIYSMKLRLWDLDGRYYRYKVEAWDGANWVMVADRRTGQNRGWQDIQLGTAVQARYVRLTGTYNSANAGFHVVEWEVYGSGSPAAQNLALASRGTTITGTNGANWSQAINGVTTGYTGSTGFGYTVWTGTPGTMTLDLLGTHTIGSMNLLLWDLDTRYYRYMIEVSTTLTGPWTTVVDRTTGQNRGWQYLSFAATQARYVRLTGTYGSANAGFHVVEWGVYGT
jgi:hypothetical protein